MQFDRHRFANFISWVISPVVVAPVAYYAIVMRGYGNDVNSGAYLTVLFFSSTIVPIFLISGLKKIGKISDFNIPFREQRFLPRFTAHAGADHCADRHLRDCSDRFDAGSRH